MGRTTAASGPKVRWRWDAGCSACCRKTCMTASHCTAATAGSRLVADVRLDNRDELGGAARLAAGRHASRFATPQFCSPAWSAGAKPRSIAWSAILLSRFGMRTRKSFLLARDFLGQRPLHYHRGRGFFAFASMPKGLHALAEVPYGPDEQAMAEFVTLMPQRGPRSFFKDIARVETGPCRHRDARWPVVPALLATATPKHGRPQPDDYVEGLRHHLDQATQSRLRGANGVVGAHLSAGFDSSAVTATAARLLAPSGGKVIAFTAVPREELRRARAQEIASATRDRSPPPPPRCIPISSMCLIRSGHLSPLDGLDRNFFLFERPDSQLVQLGLGECDQSGRPRAQAQYPVDRPIWQYDAELYTGSNCCRNCCRQGRLIALWREAATACRKDQHALARRVGEDFRPIRAGWLWQWANEAFRGRKQDIFELYRRTRRAPGRTRSCRRSRANAISISPIGRGRTGLPCALGRCAGAIPAAMRRGRLAGWGIDRRDPLADKRLVEYCLSIPTEHYLANGVAARAGQARACRPAAASGA